MRFYDDKMAGILVQTKTTGAGKRIRELPIFIGPEAWISEKGWLTMGLRLIRGRSYMFREGFGPWGRIARRWRPGWRPRLEAPDPRVGAGSRPSIVRGPRWSRAGVMETRRQCGRTMLPWGHAWPWL